MSARINMYKAYPDLYKAMSGIEKAAKESGIDEKLYELIKIRASQINGCAYCINMHTRDARKIGETDQRMHLLNAWRETDLYTPQEQAALEFTEAVTLIAQGPIPDEIYENVAKHFDEKQIAGLMTAIIAINGWNRIAITSQAELD